MSNTVVRTNVLALNSHRNLGMVGNQQARASARLSSGFRINSAADDAAGLGISETMRAQIRGLDQASRNANDGISLIQTAEGALGTVNEMVIRMRELVVQSGNDTNTEADRGRIQDEINQLKSEIDAISIRTEFNSQQLFGVSGSADLLDTLYEFDITEFDPDVDDIETINRGLRIISSALGVPIGSLSFENWTNGGDLIASLREFASGDRDFDAFSNLESQLITMLEHATGVAWTNPGDVDTLQQAADNVTLLNAINRLVDMLAGSAGGGGADFSFQIGANTNQTLEISIEDMSWGSISGNLTIDLVTAGNDIDSILEGLDEALAAVTSQRSALGAYQNRLEFTIENLDIASENLSAAESRIRDADMALEMMRMTQANVLQQAATAMLAQANQAPQNVLQLLG